MRMQAASLLRMQKAQLRAIEEPSLPMPLSMLRAEVLSSLHEQGVLAGIERISCRPVLGPLATSTELLSSLDGIRARVRLGCDAKGFSEEGELLFRSYGISGIVVFNASRFVEAGDVVSLDFVPERPLARLTDLLQARAAFWNGATDLFRRLSIYCAGSSFPKWRTRSCALR